MPKPDEITGALRDGQLCMHYQPLVALQGNSVRGVEALLRWNHPDGLLTAASFLPGLESTPIMREITEFALATACTAVATDAPSHWTVSVNLAAADATTNHLVDLVTAALDASGLAPQRLVLEITETGVLDGRHTEVARVLGLLRELGVGISLDDFGTGHSSLTLLRTLPVTELKIDSLFVGGMETNSNDAAIVTNIIRLAGAFEASVVAEGVEVLGQATLLAQLGCDYGQGYLWSRAAPLADVVDLSPATLLGKRRGRPAQVVSDRIVKMASEGASPATIAAALNSDGINTPDDKHWHQASVTAHLRWLAKSNEPYGGSRNPPERADGD
jgi:EAL domain-containing protein (putative c-di-GMP-specific phosphodiesterase class I)